MRGLELIMCLKGQREAKDTQMDMATLWLNQPSNKNKIPHTGGTKSQKKIPISYDIFFCGTSSTSVAEEEASATEEDTLAHMGKGLLINDTFAH